MLFEGSVQLASTAAAVPAAVLPAVLSHYLATRAGAANNLHHNSELSWLILSKQG
jgi:hypothetical protein